MTTTPTPPEQPAPNKCVLPIAPDMEDLFSLLAQYGGKIISTNDLRPDMIAQAKASNRMWVDNNSLGYVWEPPIAGRFPETEEEVKLFERCYPIEKEVPKEVADKVLDNIIKATEKPTPDLGSTDGSSPTPPDEVWVSKLILEKYKRVFVSNVGHKVEDVRYLNADKVREVLENCPYLKECEVIELLKQLGYETT